MKCVVLVPGIMGSGLRNDNGTVWPPTALEVIFGYKRIDELSQPNLEVTGIIPKVSLVSVYKSLIDDIKKCGYVEGGDERRFIPFPYDWRLSNEESALALAKTFDAQFPTVDEKLDITILAHSMGGLVSRFLLESGDFSDRPWFEKIRNLVTLGTPHHGAPLALKRLAGEQGTLGLSGSDVKKLGNDQRYPSLFQLVGYEGNALTTQQGLPGQLPSVLDPFDHKIESALGLNLANIASARQFWQRISGFNPPSETNYLCIAASSLKTAVRSELQSQGSSPLTIERKDGGDGTVPFSSALLPGVPTAYSRKKHGVIFEDRDVRNKLYHILEAPANVVPHSAAAGVPVGAPRAIGLSVGKDSYDIGEPIELSISYSRPRQNPNEFFSIQRFDAKTESPDTAMEPIEISSRFEGTDISGFSFSISNELEPGMYQVVPSSKVDDPTETYFFVTADNANDQ